MQVSQSFRGLLELKKMFEMFEERGQDLGRMTHPHVQLDRETEFPFDTFQTVQNTPVDLPRRNHAKEWAESLGINSHKRLDVRVFHISPYEGLTIERSSLLCLRVLKINRENEKLTFLTSSVTEVV